MVETFDHLRRCGAGVRECQLVWTSRWENIEEITRVVHPRHRAHGYGFELNSSWLTLFWLELSRRQEGIQVQVHSHPHTAFHSEVDDAFPIVHTAGFLSLVIPRFGTGPVGWEGAYLTEIQPDGGWREVSIASRLEIVE